MDRLLEVVTAISDSIWNPMIFVALAVGVFFTIWTGAVQIRHFPSVFKLLRHSGEPERGEISSFQALMLSLSSRVGVGNIAGVGVAIAAGGPGALFWMIVVALFGAASAFAESTLAQIYKRRIAGEYRGGLPYYIERGLKQKWLAMVAATITLVLYAVLAPGVQSHNIATGMTVGFGVPTWVTGIVVAGLFGIVVLGGTQRIARVADKIVPFMAVGYLLAAFIIVIANIAEMPAVIGLVLGSAFGTDQVFGGIVGAAIAWGVRRATVSNVAGMGEGTYASGAAAVSHPVKQGIIQAFSIYIDTIVVCAATGIMIIVTGSYNVENKDVHVENLPGVESGTPFTQNAIETVFPGIGAGFIAIALFLFAFTTLIAFNYISASAAAYLFPANMLRRVNGATQLIMVGVIFLGSISAADLIWAIGDIGYGALGWVNMICIVLLAGVLRKTLRDYDAQCRQGLDPVFDPVALGITGTEAWNTDTPTSSIKIALLHNEGVRSRRESKGRKNRDEEPAR